MATEGKSATVTMELWEQTKRGYILLSRVHSWAPTQAVVLAVRVSLPCGIVQWRHCGRVLQRRPVTLFAHSSEQDLRKLSGYSLHKHTAKMLWQQCRSDLFTQELQFDFI